MTTILMISVAAILAITLGVARRARVRQIRLEDENRAMRRELERHRQTAYSILEELESR